MVRGARGWAERDRRDLPGLGGYVRGTTRFPRCAFRAVAASTASGSRRAAVGGTCRAPGHRVTPSDAGSAPPTLRDVLRATPRLAPERVARLLDGIARALTARDAAYGALTPERVLVGAHDAVVLAPAPRPGAGVAPWPAYLAPEQIDGRAGDVRSDVYAMGLLGWEMLAGQQPWEGDSLYGIVVKQREQDLPRLSTLRPGLPRALVQAVEGALHKAPGDRWDSPAELATMLAGVAERTPAAAPVTAREVTTPGRVPVPPVAPAVDLPPPSARGVVAPNAIEADADDAPAPRPPGQPRPTAPRRSRAPRRWLTMAVLAIAMLAAAAGAYAVVQGRQDTTATRAWLDSVTTSSAAVGGAGAGASPALTTRENTTSVPIRRAGGEHVDPEPTDEDAPDPDAAPAPDDPRVEPIFPGYPDFPRTGRPGRPTVPPDTVVRPDTLVEPAPPLRR